MRPPANGHDNPSGADHAPGFAAAMQRVTALEAELASTKASLEEVEEVLQAIRSGAVDAVMVRGENGEQVYTLTGADLAYRQLIETMIEGAITLSSDGTILYCNVRVAETLGQPLDEVIGTRLREYIPPEDRLRFESILAEARSSPSRGEVSIRTLNGTRPVHLSVSRLQIPGTELLFCLAATDLTEARRHEEIAAAERLARSILEQVAEMIIVCDEQGRIIRMSRTAELICGQNAMLELFSQRVALQLEDGSSFDLGRVMSGETVHNLDVSVQQDGRRLELLLSAGPLRSENQIRGCVINLTDITSRKQDEAALRVRGAALNAASLGIVITDRAGRISWVNPAFTNLTGYDVEELSGLPPQELEAIGFLGSAFDGQLERTIRSGVAWHGEVTTRRKDGSQFVEDLTITPVQDAHGDITHFIALNRDLTDAQALQARLLQSQKLETVGRLAGGIAHDFNNLLTVISGIVDLALGEIREPTPLQSDLVEVQRAVNRASALTRQLLAFSRQQVLQPTVLNLNILVKDLLKMLQRLIDEDIRLELLLADDLAPVRADAGQLEQVIVNLTVNARDAMPHGGTITIRTWNMESQEELMMWHGPIPAVAYVVFGLRDTGGGMNDTTLARLFEPFFTTKLPGQGTGLGLATVHGIVTQSGGGLQVRSEVGTGSEFLVYLPRASQSAADLTSTSSAVIPTGSEVILVVDDEPALRSVTSRLLTRSGFQVLSAGSGEEARRLLAAHRGPVHLLLTDVVMPEMSGPELAEHIRRDHPDIKVLFMSGYTDDTVLRHGVDSQYAHFVDKPFSMQTLSAKVRACLDTDQTT